MSRDLTTKALRRQVKKLEIYPWSEGSQFEIYHNTILSMRVVFFFKIRLPGDWTKNALGKMKDWRQEDKLGNVIAQYLAQSGHSTVFSTVFSRWMDYLRKKFWWGDIVK